ncbi:uncharacterized protein LOC128579828 isoform X2 [Nycticebus coucang]|uniref:uncharacterized protein LOC128579828 isoform X2 n=1 Tax=Nycticebus coucang TaxID=9470 RepID=UPI00234D4583|nr:uncharacterized protein LOC128579828 isoform X2 [Nycticebus coucang]XP_053437980.1 uncharacterized protein LOC128579828 isoform X2 [Nycticebus coucang]XP_053437981.1 uncharacterized protein LOC128579828 isoform X2 [Nycticebus coucang]XP_053437983.1 uncharacterized protein LOC128579828 isoform X2 [Nycticebus coucang]XP_053437984.1 uncharacterized protein LOC128579828 isoform X2 [Nycticebus coucang]XP_053437985.1 uncharacterized protein LOC128579828 isoform X2 [Nycticebus coucang]XP_05343798
MQEVETRVLPGPPAAYLELWEPFCPGWPSRREDGRESSQRQSSPPLGLLPLSSGCQPGAQRALGGNYCPSWVPELPGFHCGSRSAQVASPTGKMAGWPRHQIELGCPFTMNSWLNAGQLQGALRPAGRMAEKAPRDRGPLPWACCRWAVAVNQERSVHLVETAVPPGPPASWISLWEPFCPGWPSGREDGR